MLLRFLFSLALIFGAAFSALAHDQNYDLEGDYLYKFTTVRADTGDFEDLLSWISEMKASNYFAQSGSHPPFVMRHSQGDQWDVMIVTPMESWERYYAAKTSEPRKRAQKDYAAKFKTGASMIAFSEDVFAYGPDLQSFETAFEDNGLFHIEMFEAAAGKTKALYKQRQMENDYLSITGQVENMIFRRAAGSDVDVFTIGFHKNFKSFAADAPASPMDKEIAAKAAGFKDRADLSFYLRSLLSGHHDTFATKVN